MIRQFKILTVVTAAFMLCTWGMGNAAIVTVDFSKTAFGNYLIEGSFSYDNVLHPSGTLNIGNLASLEFTMTYTPTNTSFNFSNLLTLTNSAFSWTIGDPTIRSLSADQNGNGIVTLGSEWAYCVNEVSASCISQFGLGAPLEPNPFEVVSNPLVGANWNQSSAVGPAILVPVPEPQTYALLASALVLTACLQSVRKKLRAVN